MDLVRAEEQGGIAAGGRAEVGGVADVKIVAEVAKKIEAVADAGGHAFQTAQVIELGGIAQEKAVGGVRRKGALPLVFRYLAVELHAGDADQQGGGTRVCLETDGRGEVL